MLTPTPPKDDHLMDAQTVGDTIRTFIAENFMVDFGPEVSPDTDLFEAKYIDSFGFVDLVTFLEQSFTIKLSEDDLAEPAMGSLAGIHGLVLERIAEREAAT
jgi:acyl carrier protein